MGKQRMMTDKTHRRARSLRLHGTRGISMVEPINDRFLEKGSAKVEDAENGSRVWPQPTSTTKQYMIEMSDQALAS